MLRPEERRRNGSRPPRQWTQEVVEMSWFVDVFDRESVRRETLRCANECSVTLYRQINEMSNR